MVLESDDGSSYLVTKAIPNLICIDGVRWNMFEDVAQSFALIHDPFNVYDASPDSPVELWKDAEQ